MAANIRTIGLSGLARALVQHDKLPDAEAEPLTHEAKSANSTFVERLIAGGRMGALEVAEFASVTLGLPLFDLGAVPVHVRGAGGDPSRSADRGGFRGEGTRRNMAALEPGRVRTLQGHRLQGSNRHIPGHAGFRRNPAYYHAWG